MLRDISDTASLLKFFYIQSAPPETNNSNDCIRTNDI